MLLLCIVNSYILRVVAIITIYLSTKLHSITSWNICSLCIHHCKVWGFMSRASGRWRTPARAYTHGWRPYLDQGAYLFVSIYPFTIMMRVRECSITRTGVRYCIKNCIEMLLLDIIAVFTWLKIFYPPHFECKRWETSSKFIIKDDSISDLWQCGSIFNVFRLHYAGTSSGLLLTLWECLHVLKLYFTCTDFSLLPTNSTCIYCHSVLLGPSYVFM
jgi:hypothetical protein